MRRYICWFGVMLLCLLTVNCGGGGGADSIPDGNGDDAADDGTSGDDQVDDDPWVGPAVTFERMFGTAGEDVAHAVLEVRGGGYLVAGTTDGTVDGNSDIYLARLDVDGTSLWSTTIGGAGDDSAYGIVATNDDGFVIAGSTDSIGAGGLDVYLVKVDAAGKVLWSRTVGGVSDEAAHAIDRTTDNGFIVAGYTKSSGAGRKDMYLIKTDASGNELWSLTFGGTETDQAYSVEQTTDGGYLLAGEAWSFNANGSYLVKTDINGVEQWARAYGDSPGAAIQASQTSDNGYIMVGMSGVIAPEMGDIFLTKTNASGVVQWSREFGGFAIEFGAGVVQVADHGFVVAGYTQSIGAGGQDVYLFKTDGNGEQDWAQTFGATGNDTAYAMRLTRDGGFVMVGQTDASGTGDIYVVKTDADGILP